MTEDLTAIAETEIREGYKNTKIGWIPKDWQLKPLGKILEFKNGVNAGKESYGTGRKFINVMEVIKHHVITDSDIPGMVNVPNSVFKQNQVKSGDILFNRTSETKEDIGLTTLYIGDENVVFGGFVIRGRPTNSLLTNNFKKYAFSSSIVRKQIVSKGQGAIRTNVGQKDLEKVYLPVPTDEEQHKITAVLSSWDAAIEKLNRLIEQKELRKKGLMQQLLSGKKRLPEFSGEWKRFKYKDVLKEVKRSFDWNDEDLYRLISVRRRSGGLFHREDLHGHQIKTKTLKEAKEGDFLISKMQIVHGASGLTTKKFDGMKISGSYISLKSRDEKKLDINYFNWYSKTPFFYHQSYTSSYGVHIEKMTFDFKLFLNESLLLPEIQEQKAITRVLEAADKEIDLLKEKLEKLRNQKKGLMQVLLTGKKRIKA